MKQRIEACQFVWAGNKLDIHVIRGDGQHRPVSRVYSARYDNWDRLSRLVNLGCILLNGVVLRMALNFYYRDSRLVSRNP